MKKGAAVARSAKRAASQPLEQGAEDLVPANAQAKDHERGNENENEKPMVFKDGREIKQAMKVRLRQEACFLQLDASLPHGGDDEAAVVESHFRPCQIALGLAHSLQKLGEDVSRLCPTSPEVCKKKRGRGKSMEDIDLRQRLKTSWGNKVGCCIPLAVFCLALASLRPTCGFN